MLSDEVKRQLIGVAYGDCRWIACGHCRKVMADLGEVRFVLRAMELWSCQHCDHRHWSKSQGEIIGQVLYLYTPEWN